tara:strand:- start:422 stop:658 length:237 start_codon:yes stop_codon:yes gene_type:complete
MDNKDKTAIENLVIIARYMQDNSLLSTNDESILERSIARAEGLIGTRVGFNEDPIELGEIGEINVRSYIEALKNRKKP